MDMSVATLSRCFLGTFSATREPRREAEEYLAESSKQLGYGIAVLQLVADVGIDENIRHAAAVNFKNHVRLRWIPQPEETGIDSAEKEKIKTLIVPLMLASAPRIQGQLSEALVVISKHDFPKSWPSLLPELVSNLRGASDYTSINGLLGTANSIFKKFRYQFQTTDLLLDLKYCLDVFAQPLLEVFLKTSHLIDANSQSSELLPLIESQRLCCRIFYSLNFQELPEFFEDHMKEWMSEFQKYLTTAYLALEKDADGIRVVDDLRAAICDNICLYMEKNEEEFKDYLSGFASAVWKLLITITADPARDRVVVTAIKFLTTVSTSVHHSIFSAPGVLEQICESIVFPNVRLQSEDEELFEFNHVEYMRRDIEGSDLDTRRRTACELLKGIATHYKVQVTELTSKHIETMLNLYFQNPEANWKHKDCAIYLVVALATKKAGGNLIFTDLVSIESFFSSMIAPELKSTDMTVLPLIKADALKFLTVFRGQIPKQMVLAILPDVTRFLSSKSNVVHSYAANCIEKLLLVKDDGRPRYSSSDINPILATLMNNLFNALKFPESQENSYIMKCIMRVIGVADVNREVAVACITSLTAILKEVCQNPRNPSFNHYIFEAVAALIRRSCEHDPTLIPLFESNIFPVLEFILVNDISEFWPYIFQVFAQLIEINKHPLSANYMQIFEILLAPATWRRSGNVPALVRVLKAYLHKAPNELSRDGRLNQVLGISEKLVSSSSTEEQGFYVLNTIVETLSFEVIKPFVGHIWSRLFLRLQDSRNVRFVKSLVVFMSLFLVKYSHDALVGSINEVQTNIFAIILDQFWIPHLQLITGPIEIKLTSVASTRLICEAPMLLDDSASVVWGKMLNSIITLLSKPEQDRIEEEAEVPDFGENIGYSAAFVRLYNAGKNEDDLLKEVRDPKEVLVTSLARLSTLSPGKYSAIIQKTVDPSNQSALFQFLAAYNCHIV